MSALGAVSGVGSSTSTFGAGFQQNSYYDNHHDSFVHENRLDTGYLSDTSSMSLARGLAIHGKGSAFTHHGHLRQRSSLVDSMAKQGIPTRTVDFF